MGDLSKAQPGSQAAGRLPLKSVHEGQKMGATMPDNVPRSSSSQAHLQRCSAR